MEDHAKAAREWRDRATALRALAKNMTHPAARNDLMEIVERWQTKAETADFRLRLVRRQESRVQADSRGD